MAEVQLAAEARRQTGSGESRRLRAAGKIPAILYGHGIEPQSVTVDGRALRGALNGEAGLNALLTLQIDSVRHLAMARQLQKHPVKGTVEHVDFVIVRRDEIVSVEVPVRLEGEALEVQHGNGVVEQQLFTITVNATPGNIPQHFDVDVSKLRIGDMIRVGDLKLPTGVTTDLDADEPVVVASGSTVAAEMAEIEAEEEAAAVEAAEAAEGEAPEGAEPTGEGGGGAGPTEG